MFTRPGNGGGGGGEEARDAIVARGWGWGGEPKRCLSTAHYCADVYLADMV